MRRSLHLVMLVGVAAGAALVAACGFDGVGELTSNGATSGGDAASDALVADGGPTPTDGSSSDAPADAPLDASDGSIVRGPGIVYGHSPLYAVDATTGACTVIANQPQPFTLTFVAAGTVDAANEALVAYLNADYVRINRATGIVTLITANALGAYLPSGDLVSAGSGAYVSVTGPACGDCLLEVNPTTGVIVKNLGSIGQSGIVGLGLWAGIVYGFAGSGETYAITIGATSVTSARVVNANKPAGGFIGGGSTTAAPN